MKQAVKDFFFVVDAQSTEKLHELYDDLPLLPERLKKLEKLVSNLQDKTEFVIYIKNLKQALKHRLILKKVHRGIEFIQKWLDKTIYWYEPKSKIAKIDFEKDPLKLINNVAFKETSENIEILTCRNRKKKNLFDVRTK